MEHGASSKHYHKMMMESVEKETSKIIRKNKPNLSGLTQSQLDVRQKVGKHTGRFRIPNILRRKPDPSKATQPRVSENIDRKKLEKIRKKPNILRKKPGSGPEPRASGPKEFQEVKFLFF